jgi:hypothetical protein
MLFVMETLKGIIGGRLAIYGPDVFPGIVVARNEVW